VIIIAFFIYYFCSS